MQENRCCERECPGLKLPEDKEACLGHMAGRDDELKRLFAQNDMHYDWAWNSRGNLEVSVVNGDWRHDHLALDYLMGKNGYEKVEERYSGIPTGGDWYSAVHVFNKKEAGNDA